MKGLLAELDHRVKNTLALCTAIAAQTLRSAASPEAFVGSFQRRLQALAQAHGLLTRNRWDQAPLRALVEAELAPFREGAASRVALDGPEIRLRPNATIILGMAVHELATNATKHGALSVPQGRVAVTWSITGPADGQTLRLDWRESGGPPIRPPEATGFGRHLIERNLAYELEGTAALAFHPDGLRCSIEIPLSNATGGAVVDGSEGG